MHYTYKQTNDKKIKVSALTFLNTLSNVVQQHFAFNIIANVFISDTVQWLLSSTVAWLNNSADELEILRTADLI